MHCCSSIAMLAVLLVLHQSHQTTFWDDCNLCVCYYGRAICTGQTCTGSQAKCNCTAEYDPVCTKSGRTIPNACTARCMGYSSSFYHTGACGSVDICSTDTCGKNSKCLPNRRICLSHDEATSDCQQYTCAVDEDCVVDVPSEPVCDSSNHQHSDLCALLRTQEDFGYYGYCRSECSRLGSEQVCGVNGETFETRCHAESMHIAVDYNAPCKAVPQSDTQENPPCPDVACPLLPDCDWVLPRDSCCPKCGAHVTILMDRESLYRNSEGLRRPPMTSVDIIKRLRHYVSTLQCDLYGHVALDNTFSILVLPIVNSSSGVVVDVCNQEAVRLATLINTRTPAISSDPVLSHLIGAHVATPRTGPFIPATRDPTTEGIVSINGDRSCHSLSLIIVTFALLLSFIIPGLFSYVQLPFVCR